MHPVARVTLVKEDLSTGEAASLSPTQDVTSDLFVQTVEQPPFHGHRLSLVGHLTCGPPGARTRHLGIKSPLLYPMS